MPPERRVIVIGAGLAGSALAVALAARGLAVTVVERRKPLLEPLPDVRGLVLSAASRAVLEDSGLWSRLAPSATPMSRATRRRFSSTSSRRSSEPRPVLREA